jgi:hypothetical protein
MINCSFQCGFYFFLEKVLTSVGSNLACSLPSKFSLELLVCYSDFEIYSPNECLLTVT